jgi:hypothetical protein
MAGSNRHLFPFSLNELSDDSGQLTRTGHFTQISIAFGSGRIGASVSNRKMSVMGILRQLTAGEQIPIAPRLTCK